MAQKIMLNRDDFKHLVSGGTIVVKKGSAQTILQIGLEDSGYQVMYQILEHLDKGFDSTPYKRDKQLEAA